MSMLTKVVTTRRTEETINEEIHNQQAQGWFLRGTPMLLGDSSVMLTFEQEEEPEEYSNEFPDEIPEDIEECDYSSLDYDH